MMQQVAFQKSPKDFLGRCGAWLQKNEVEHNLILSLCQMAEQKQKKGEKIDINLVTLFDDDECVVAAVQTPPQNLILSRASQPDIEKLAETLANQNTKIPGVIGPSDVSGSFANDWTKITGRQTVETLDQIIYALTSVLMPEPIDGRMRKGKPGEEKHLAAWLKIFSEVALTKVERLTEEKALENMTDMVKTGTVYVWDVGGKPVSMARVRGTDTISRIGSVYTPDENRGKGYASAIVAQLSKQELEGGKKMCCLYADARNTVSNSIYRKIGYEFVGRSSQYILEP